MKFIRIGLVVALVLAAAAYVGVGLPEGATGAEQASQGITVTGTGKVTTVPDEAQFSFGVQTRRTIASEASEANARGMRKLIAALKAAGVRDVDMQTEEVSVWPVYSDSGSNVAGFVASNSVSVTVAAKRAGAIVEAAAAGGANQISGPNLTRSDADALYQAALREAVADARSHAQTLAAATGADIGAVISISEGDTSDPYTYGDTRTLAAEAAPIELGSEEVDATVTVTYAIA